MADRPEEKADYFVCPHCGEDVSVGATVCRECGASDDSGWEKDDAGWQGDPWTGYLDDDDPDYEEFIDREFPASAALSSEQRIKRVFTGIVVALVCLSILAWSLLGY